MRKFKRAYFEFKIIAVLITVVIVLSLFFTDLLRIKKISASVLPSMPAPTEILHVGVEKDLTILQGIKIYPNEPLKFDFIINEGDSDLTPQQLKTEVDRLIRYFLAALTIPEEDLWVNLSPYESERIIPEELGKTDLGRDMLAEDYVLKQLSSSLTYPEIDLGNKFWKKINSTVNKQYGNINIPIENFNKIWIVPKSATIYQDKDKAFIKDSKFKVMLESDYFAMTQQQDISDKSQTKGGLESLYGKTMKEIILPEIEREANEGENFAQLRQIYSSLLLANWYKNKLKNSIVNKLYADKKKIVGVDVDDPSVKDKIYNQYVKAFQKGVYNYIRKETDPVTKKINKRKYFSGGFKLASSSITQTLNIDPNQLIQQAIEEQPDKMTYTQIKLVVSSSLEGVDVDQAKWIFQQNNLSPEPDAELSGLFFESKRFIREPDLIKYIQKALKYNRGRSIVTDDHGRREVWWKNLRDDLKEIPKFFRVANEIGLNYKETLALLYLIPDSDDEGYGGSAEQIEGLLKIFKSLNAEGLSVSSDDYDFLVKTIKLLIESGGRPEWGLQIIATMIRSGLPFSECLQRMYNVTDDGMALAASYVYSRMNNTYNTLRVVRINNKENLIKISKLIAGEGQNKRITYFNYYDEFRELMYLGVVKGGYTPDEIAEVFIALAARYTNDEKLFLEAKKKLLPLEGSEPDSKLILTSSQERDRYFAKIEGKLIHNLMPYQIDRGFDDGMADLRTLALDLDETSEGFWVFAPETNTWYSFGGETIYRGKSVRHEFFPYDISKLSRTPVLVHIHPENGEYVAAVSRNKLQYQQFYESLGKYSAVMPSGADYKLIAELLEEAEEPIEGLKNYIVNSLGVTEVVCPRTEIDGIKEISEQIVKLRDETMTQFDVEAYLAQGLDEGNFGFVKRLGRDLNTKLLEGFKVELLSEGTKFDKEIARLKTKDMPLTDITAMVEPIEFEYENVSSTILPKKIVVTSKSNIKVEAVGKALSEIFHDKEFEVVGVKAKSGVNEQPVDDETEIGALNRITSAEEILIEQYGDISETAVISIENGIFKGENGKWEDKAVVAMKLPNGNIYKAVSQGVAFPREAVEATKQKDGGFAEHTVGETLSQQYAEQGIIIDKQDPQSFLTKGKLSRDIQMNSVIKQVVKQMSTSSSALQRDVGGLDFNVSKAELKIVGNAEELELSSSAISIDSTTFQGFTYELLKIEKLSNENNKSNYLQ